VKRPKTAPILVSEAVYAGLKREQPDAPVLANGWLKPSKLKIPDYSGTIYECDVIYPPIRDG